MILEGAIGDAYGAGFEFADRARISSKNNLTRYEPHPKFSSIYKKYTDDTQMAIAIAELILENSRWDKLTIANKFVEVFKRDPREGYALRFHRLLSEVSSGQELLKKIVPKSDRNGAAMRAYPLGIIQDEKTILERAEQQAKITHNTQAGIQSAQAIALINHFFIYQKGTAGELINYLNDIQNVQWKGNWVGEVQINGIQTVEAVITILMTETSLSQMLKASVDLGGDVDTVASLTLAIGSSRPDINKDLPPFLYDQLENQTFGRSYLEKLDRKIQLFLNPL